MPHPRKRAGIGLFGTALAWLSPVAFALSTGCIGFISGNGSLRSETRTVEAIHSVTAHSSVDVDITVAPLETPASLTVHCDDNLIDLIETDVDEGRLIVDVPPAINIQPRSDCYVELVTHELRQLRSSGSASIDASGLPFALEHARTSGSGEIRAEHIQTTQLVLGSSGSGNLTLLQVEADTVEATCSGSGAIRIEGSTPQADYSVSGSGDIDAQSMVASHVVARATGSGDVRLHATSSIDATTSGSGSIEVWGTPPAHSESSSGSGSVIYH